MEQATANQDSVVDACSFRSRIGGVHCLVSQPFTSVGMSASPDRETWKKLTFERYRFQRSEDLKVMNFVNERVDAKTRPPFVGQRLFEMISKAFLKKKDKESSRPTHSVSA